MFVYACAGNWLFTYAVCGQATSQKKEKNPIWAKLNKIAVFHCSAPHPFPEVQS